MSDETDRDLTPAEPPEPDVTQAEAARAEFGQAESGQAGAAKPEPVDAENPGSGAAATASPVDRRRRTGVVVLLALAAIGGAVGSWVYNHGYKVRAANNSAVIRSGANLSTYVSPGDYTAVTVPIRNDSPYQVTVIGLTVPNAPKLQWDDLQTVIPPNSTANLRLFTRGECEASPHPLKVGGPVTVVVRVLTINGKMHGSLQELISGAIQYADDRCAIPSASETA